MRAVLNSLSELVAAGERFVMVTVAGTRGSTPRDVGAKMIVTPRTTLGTIGGGQLEYQCTALACEWFRAPAAPQTFRRTFTLGANCGQCCGGVAEVLIEQIDPRAAEWLAALLRAWQGEQPAVLVTLGDTRTGVQKLLVERDAVWHGGGRPHPAAVSIARELLASGAPACKATVALAGNVQSPALFEPLQPAGFGATVFGAGHVGRALVAALAPVARRIHWVESRVGVLPDTGPANVVIERTDDPATVAAGARAGGYFVVMTHSHALDLEICARLLERGDFAFCGLIGSVAKRRQFERRFRALGLSDAAVGRLTCPIGVSGISGKRPAEIAIATAAQLLLLHEREIARESGTDILAATQ